MVNINWKNFEIHNLICCEEGDRTERFTLTRHKVCMANASNENMGKHAQTFNFTHMQSRPGYFVLVLLLALQCLPYLSAASDLVSSGKNVCSFQQR